MMIITFRAFRWMSVVVMLIAMLLTFRMRMAVMFTFMIMFPSCSCAP